MKSTELRIGNWIFDDENELCQVASLESQEFNDFNGVGGGLVKIIKNGDFMETAHVSPIPLTPEILEAVGWKYINGRGKTGCYRFEKIRINIEETFSIISIKQPNSRFMELVRIHSVHQLQNLYFALTNQEITINL